MRRPESVRFILAMAAVTSLVTACDPPVPPPQDGIAVLFDPTVRVAEDSTEIRRILSQLGSLFTSTSVGARLWVGVVSPGAANDPVADTTFRLSREYGGNEKRLTEIRAWADVLSDSLFLRWKGAHGAKEFRRPQSCLGSSLYFLNQQVKPGRAAHVVIVSDMVEACSESSVNLERQPPSSDLAQKLVDEMGLVDFSRYCSITVVWIPHARYQTPRRIDELKAFWDGVFGDIGADVRHERSFGEVVREPPWEEACDGLDVAFAAVGESETRGAAGLFG